MIPPPVFALLFTIGIRHVWCMPDVMFLSISSAGRIPPPVVAGARKRSREGSNTASRPPLTSECQSLFTARAEVLHTSKKEIKRKKKLIKNLKRLQCLNT